jgi:hypothetical protein
MGDSSRIEWTDATWNPTTGCRRVSPGCDHCYAATLAKRLKAMGNPRYQVDGPDGDGFGLTLHWDKLEEPLSWRRPRRIFVDSMSDLFHPEVSEAFLLKAFEVMANCPQHQFQILTKRPPRMAKVVPWLIDQLGKTPSNVWLGTSMEEHQMKQYLLSTQQPDGPPPPSVDMEVPRDVAALEQEMKSAGVGLQWPCAPAEHGHLGASGTATCSPPTVPSPRARSISAGSASSRRPIWTPRSNGPARRPGRPPSRSRCDRSKAKPRTDPDPSGRSKSGSQR